MFFSWNPAKRIINIKNHGIDFVDVPFLFVGRYVETPARTGPNGEKRTKAFGLVEGRCITVVYTRRGETYRIISARPASRNERREFGDLLVARSAAE